MALIGIAALGAACGSPPAPRSAAPASTPSLATAAAELTKLASPVEAGGVVRARGTAVIASRLMAPITDVRVLAGDRVRRGDVLVRLDARDLSAHDARAQAASSSAAASLRAAEADVRAGESAVRLARLMHDRMVVLEAKRSATAAELDQAAAALSSAQAQHAAAVARLAAASAERDAANAGALAATVTAAYATITAPFDGIVAERNAEPGSMAVPGLPLLTLEDPTTYRLEVRLDEARAGVVARGGDAVVRLDDRDTPMTGRVAEIARLDSASHSFLVKIDLPPGAGVRSGQFGRASFSGPPRQAMTIPASAVVRRGQLTFVFVADPEQRVRLQPVSVGPGAGQRIEVLAGLRPGDRVVISPALLRGGGDPLAGARP